METFRDDLENLDIQINNLRKDLWDFLDKMKELEKKIKDLEELKKKQNFLKQFFKKIKILLTSKRK